MKKSILVIKSLIVMGALFMVSCNNDDGVKCPDALTGALTATETDFAGTWKFTAMVGEEAIDVTPDKTVNPSKDIYGQFTACQQDLVYNFNADRAYSQKLGYVAEACQKKESITGTWALNAGQLSFVASCATQSMNIVLNETKDAFSYSSVLNFQDANEGLKTTKVTFTYEKVVE